MIIKISSPAKKQLSKISQNHQKKIARHLDNLSQNPLLGKKLQGHLKNYYSIRVWPYRIIYQVKPNKFILIFSIRHRQSAYKQN